MNKFRIPTCGVRWSQTKLVNAMPAFRIVLSVRVLECQRATINDLGDRENGGGIAVPRKGDAQRVPFSK